MPFRSDRVDLAVRSIARHVAAMGSRVLAVVAADGAVTVVLATGAGEAPSPWRDGAVPGGREQFVVWTLPSSVTDDYLRATAAATVPPCPALVHLGVVAGGGDVFVDLEAVGVLWLDTPHAAELARHLALAFSATLGQGSGEVMTVAVEHTIAGDSAVRSFTSVEAACAAAARSTVGVAAEVDVGGVSSFAMRAVGDGERWECAVVVSAAAPGAPVVVGAGRGLGVVAPVGSGRWDAAGWYVRSTSGGHLLEPLGLRLTPVGLTVDEAGIVVDLVDAAEEHLEHVAPVVPIVAAREEAPPFVEPPWRVMVRLLGPVQVTSADGQVAEIGRAHV